MIHFDEFRKDNGPAHGESESEYFLRLTNKYRKLHKLEMRKLRVNRLIQGFTSAAKRLIVTPNLLHTKSV